MEPGIFREVKLFCMKLIHRNDICIALYISHNP